MHSCATLVTIATPTLEGRFHDLPSLPSSHCHPPARALLCLLSMSFHTLAVCIALEIWTPRSRRFQWPAPARGDADAGFARDAGEDRRPGDAGCTGPGPLASAGRALERCTGKRREHTATWRPSLDCPCRFHRRICKSLLTAWFLLGFCPGIYATKNSDFFVYTRPARLYIHHVPLGAASVTGRRRGSDGGTFFLPEPFGVELTNHTEPAVLSIFAIKRS